MSTTDTSQSPSDAAGVKNILQPIMCKILREVGERRRYLLSQPLSTSTDPEPMWNSGDCLEPLITADDLTFYDTSATPQDGDLVRVRWGDSHQIQRESGFDFANKFLQHLNGQAWLLCKQGAIPLHADDEICGVLCAIRSTGRTHNGILLANECIQFNIDSVQVLDSTGVGIRANGNSTILTRLKIGKLTNSYVAGSNGAGVSLDYVETATVEANRFGYSTAYAPTAETTQTFAVSVGSNGAGVIVQNNFVGGTVGGIPYSKTGATQNCVLRDNVGFRALQGNWRYGGTPVQIALTFGGTVTPDCLQGSEFTINVTTGGAFTIALPLNPMEGMLISITPRNASGGAMGAITWNAAFKMAAWTNPANGFNRTITFRYDNPSWIEVNRTTVDVPN